MCVPLRRWKWGWKMLMTTGFVQTVDKSINALSLLITMVYNNGILLA